jgi:reactive intermediate/imine deaminase
MSAYSQGIRKGGIISTTQVGDDPETRQLAEGTGAQTRQTLKNITSVLEAAGASWGDVVKTTCFLRDIRDFDEFNAVYSEMVPEPRPARATVGVQLSGTIRVEIEALAVLSAPSDSQQ